jgi:hypothetical protein
MIFTPKNAREFGARGGRSTFERHGSNHMRCIGYAGYLVNVERNFFGDFELYREWLRTISRGCVPVMPEVEECQS